MIVFGVLGSIAVVATVAAFFGGQWWWFDLLASFRPQLAIVTLLVGIVLMAARRRKTGLVVMAAAAVNLAVIVPLYHGPSGAAAGGSPLSVMSFNVHGSNDRYDDVLAYIRSTSPDVVFLHEVTGDWEEAVRGADLGYQVVSGRENTWFGTLALVPQSAEAVSHGFLRSEPRAIEVVLDTTSGPVSMLGIHPLSPVTEERAELRDSQIGFAAEWAASREGPAIVVGDFNASPWSAAFRRLLRDGDLQDSERGHGLQLSFPATSSPLFRVPIDHLVHSEDVVVTDRRLGRAVGSDHFSLLVDLMILV